MTWMIDPAHTQITFSVRHMMIATVRGRFENFEGVVAFDEQHPERTSVDLKIDTASINTREPKRDGHLRSPDFFAAETYPYAIFKSKRVDVKGDRRARLVGDLTIRDVTKEVAIDVEYAGQARSPWGAVSAGFSGRAKINRKDWGLTWNQALETGGVLVGDEVTLDLGVELIKQVQPQAEAVATV